MKFKIKLSFKANEKEKRKEIGMKKQNEGQDALRSEKTEYSTRFLFLQNRQQMSDLNPQLCRRKYEILSFARRRTFSLTFGR